MTVLRTMWGNAVAARIRAQRIFVLDVVLANLLLAGLPRALALDPDRRISQYGHTVWRIQDGAIGPPTNIAQTADGFLWITTAQGLMRFDGVRFMLWQPPQGQNLPGTHFSALLGARDGSLWIGTTRGLARWKDGQLRTYTDLEHPAAIFEIMEDDFGTIWATRYGANAREAPLCSISKETLRCFGKKDGLPIPYGLGLTHDSEGNLWIGSTVLVRWRLGTPATTFFGEDAELAKTDGVINVALGPSGTAWASLDGTGPRLGLQYYSGGKWTSYAVPGFDQARIRPNLLLVDRRGALWVGTKNDGVYRICSGVADHYVVSDGLSGNGVESFFEDREGNIWVLTDGGLDMFRDTALISYTTRQGVSDSAFHSVMALRNGEVWISTLEAVNILRKQEGKTSISYRKVSGQGVGSMLEDHSGVVWLEVDLALMRFQNGRFREIQAPGGQSFTSFGGVKAIAEDSGGTIWVLTPRGQLFSIVGDIIRQATPNDGLGRQNYLMADPNGGLWLAGMGAISHFRDGRLQRTSLSSPQGPAGIRTPFVDSDNSLLVPSSQGLYRLNHGQLTLFSSDNGLPCPESFNVIRDNHGALWIYTRCGLVRIAEPEWAKWIASPHVAVSVMILDALDGAQAGTGDSDQPASSKAPDGRLWFQTGVSVQVLDPDRLYENALPPPVYVEGVVADRKRFDATSLVKVPALSRDLEIDYTAPSFSVPQKVRFRYMLEGRDREWQDAGTRRQAFYTDLKPAHYRFRVTACNSQGVWNQTGASLDFVIPPAWYQTTGFRSLCVAAFLAFLWGLYRLRVQQLRREERKLREAIESIPVMAWIARPDGVAEFVNRRVFEYSGLLQSVKAEEVGKITIHPEDRDRIVRRWGASFASGEPYEEEMRVRRADGEYRWFLSRGVPLRDKRGKVVKWYGAAADIQDRKHAEEVLRESERSIRLIVDGIAGLVAIMTPDGQVEYVNNQTVEYFGRPLEQLKGWATSDAVHPDDLPRAVAAWKHSVETGNTFDIDERLRGADGAYRWFHIRGLPLLDAEGRIIRWYNLLTDIDERKRAEAKLQDENVALREEIAKVSMFEEIVGTSSPLQTVLSRISKVAPSDSSVLITGETGTGKELVARAIHRRSRRSSRPFVSVNCAAIPRDLIASELFGHEKGAFTGATQRRIGRFELADGGTIFLDEVGELSPDTQVALLRVLQEREFERLGGNQRIHVDVRIVTATNRNLEAAVSSGSFRQDLLYRLNVFPIEVPPLRERRDDILMLVEYFVQRYASRAGKNIRSIDKRTLDLLHFYDWPGNIRELQNVIERSVILNSGEVFSVDESWLSKGSSGATSRVQTSAPPKVEAEDSSERAIIEAALAESRGRVSGLSGAAAKLGIPPSTLDHRINALKINKTRFKFR